MVLCCWRPKGQKLNNNAEKLHPHRTSTKDKDPEISCITEPQLTWERVIQAQKYSEQKGFLLIESSYSRDQEQKTYKNLCKGCFQNRGGQYTTEWTEECTFPMFGKPLAYKWAIKRKLNWISIPSDTYKTKSLIMHLILHQLPKNEMWLIYSEEINVLSWAIMLLSYDQCTQIMHFHTTLTFCLLEGSQDTGIYW